MKKIIVLLCLLVGMISCKTASESTDSDLTQITMNDVSKDSQVIELMNSNDKTKGKTLNWYQLKISDTSKDQICLGSPIEESKEPSKIVDEQKLLKTRYKGTHCTYTLDLTLGTKEKGKYTPYFEGSTDIGGSVNPYSPTGVTAVEITLRFKPDGKSVRVDVAKAEAKTSLKINVKVKGAKEVQYKDLVTCPYVGDVQFYQVFSGEETFSQNVLVVEGDASNCINEALLTKAGLKFSKDYDYGDPNNINLFFYTDDYVIKLDGAIKNKLVEKKEYSLVDIEFSGRISDLMDDIIQQHEQQGDATFDINSEPSVEIKYYKFNYSASKSLKIKEKDYKSKIWSRE